jgi:CheY-like chemotaxis protein
MYDHNFVGAIPSLFYPHRWAIVHLATAPGQLFSNQLKQTFNGPATLLSGGNYRVLVIDIKPGKDRIRGWDVARRARAINPDLPVVYITGANADEWAVQGVPNSVLLNKPFAPAQLITAVSQLLNTGSPIA